MLGIWLFDRDSTEMSKASRQGMCTSELPRFLIGSEGGESRELDDTDMRKISGHYGEEEEEDEDQVQKNSCTTRVRFFFICN